MSQILDHLWQSTLVALAAAILILALRKVAAGVRYGLWFAASVKFLVPFAALAALGRLLAPAGLFPARAEAAAIEQAAQPLTRFPFAHDAALQAPLAPSAAHAPLVHGPTAHAASRLDLAPVLLAVWVLGSAAVLLVWAIRWARVRRIVRAARPIAWPAPMPVLISPSLMEPGLIGFLRPVLVVPETLPERLTRSEIDAILAHEITHLRRRDNLTAAMHMLVEALFWFHPLVWWIGARLIAERETACDEAVVAAGHDRAAYARSLVESCRLYLQAPLSCVAGASGSDLKSRVEAIMTAPPASPLSPVKKALLLAAGAGAFATPVAAGLLSSPEGQKAVAHATAITAGALGVRPAINPAPDEQTVVLARKEAVLAPALTIAGLNAPQTRLSRDIAAPAAMAPLSVATAEPAVASPAGPPLAAPQPAAPPINPAEAKTLAADFVKAYAAATPFHTISRWGGPICVHVVGLSPEQAAAVGSRVEEVAASLGLPAKAECQRYNIQIGFTEDPQGMLDGVKDQKGDLLGDRTSATRDARTVTRPIEAWYETNGVLYGENERGEAGGLKVRVLYQLPGTVGPDGYAVPLPDAGGGGPVTPSFPAGGRFASEARLFRNVFVIVDLRKTGGERLGVIADYAAMLALSQPRALGQCNVLPSITDLFANCAGRPPPGGLTPADAAYLTALYSAPGAVIGVSHQTHVAQRMAELLANPRLAAMDVGVKK